MHVPSRLESFEKVVENDGLSRAPVVRGKVQNRGLQNSQ
jgi:hypothetical protein